MDRNDKDGVLYVVATPIGNLEDITLRALRILKEVGFILCEDTRTTSKLLNKYQIKNKLISLHKFNEREVLDKALSLLRSNRKLALVSDAGTPLVSDPGAKLILEARKSKIKIIPIPGPSSLTSSLSICGFSLDEVMFIGFLPSSKNKRKEVLLSLKKKSKTVFIFIAPHDLKEYAMEIYEFYPDVELFFARELTKIHEESWQGSIKDFLDQIRDKKIKGEIVIGLNFAYLEKETNNLQVDNEVIIKEMKNYIDRGHSLKEASKLLGKKSNISSRALYNLYISKLSQVR